MAHVTTSTNPLPESLDGKLFLRVKEFARITSTPAPTIYALIAAGKIPGVVRIGQSLRIPVKAVQELLNA